MEGQAAFLDKVFFGGGIFQSLKVGVFVQFRNLVKERLKRNRHSPAFVVALLKKAAGKNHHSAQVAQSHHAKSVTGKSVVGVVPFRPLGVEPDSAVRNKVGQLCQNQLQDFCRHRHKEWVSVLSAKLGVASVLLGVGQNLVVKVAHECDCVARIFFDVGIHFDVIRNVGRCENLFVQQFGQNLGVVLVLQLQKLCKINDLVVVPVADVGPRIVGLRDFPVKAIPCDAVGVKAVRSRRVKEF